MEHVPIEQECSWEMSPDSFGFRDPIDQEPKVSNSTCICPCCGIGTKAMHIGRFGKNGLYRLASHYCITVQNINGHLAVLSWYIRKYCNKEGSLFYEPAKSEGVLMIGKKLVRLAGSVRVQGGGMSYFKHWESRKRYYENLGAVAKCEIIPFSEEEVYQSDACITAFEDFLKNAPEDVEIRPATYLRLWIKKPQVENLVRSGCTRIVCDVLNESITVSGYWYSPSEIFDFKKTCEYFDWKKKKPHEILQIEKQEMQKIKKLDLETFNLYLFLKNKKGIRLTEEYCEKAKEVGSYQMQKILEEEQDRHQVTPVKLINYLFSQKKKKSSLTPRYLKDYWNMLYQVYGELPKEMIYPKDLEKAHDQILKLQKEKEEREITEKIAKQSLKFEEFCYEDEVTDLFIRPVHSQSELIQEGKILNHCVAIYAKEVSGGKTMIFFIRRRSEPDKPYFTLEYQNGKVVQNRGKSNCARTEEVKLFESLWLEYIKKGKKKNGKSCSRKRAAS